MSLRALLNSRSSLRAVLLPERALALRATTALTQSGREYSIALGSGRRGVAPPKETVVVVGTGWAAYRFMQTVDYSRFEVKVGGNLTREREREREVHVCACEMGW
jgi:hypothetical protein